MTRHFEPGQAVDLRACVVEHTTRDLIDAAASFAADVLVMTLPDLESSPTVPEVDPIEHPLALEQAHRPED